MKKKDILDIVDELIELEPTLTEHRAELEKSVEAILKAKPNVKITPAFKKKLLSELQTVIATTPQSLSPLEHMQKFFYAIGGAAVASIALYVTVINPMVPLPTPSDMDSDGNEYMAEEMAVQRDTMMMDDTMKSRPQSGGGGAAMNTVGYGGGGGIPPMADSRMIAPGEPYPYTSVQYVYDGAITLPEDGDVSAYKRLPLKSGSKADLLTGTFVDNLMDVDQLSSLSVTNVSLSEAGDEPLMVNVDFNEGYVSINRQINYNNRPESKCRDEACFQQYRLKERDMISDERAIDIATEFLANLGVDTSTYGEPLLQDDWRYRLEREKDTSNFYFPEQMSVTFPYLVNGTPVYDEWGNANGMTVNVDVRLRAAIGLWGLRTMSLESEAVDTVTDPEIIREVAKAGGVNSFIPPEAQVTEATLGQPRLVYVSRYQWDEDTMMGYEKYVPALYFPVTDMPEESYEIRRAVVVPITQDILSERPTDMPKPMPLPMPVEPNGMMDGSTDEMMEMEMMEGQAG